MRTGWAELPTVVRAAVSARTGPVGLVEDVPHGFTCRFAAILSTAGGGVFVKGVPVEDEQGVMAQGFEVAVNSAVAAVSPRLLWRVEAGGWDVLGFEVVPGRHADLSSGSSDLPLVAAVLEDAQGLRVPEGVVLPQLADRDLDGFLAPAGRELLLGDALLHTDTNPHNLLVGAGRAWLVDWALPVVGPAWVDVAYMAVWLMSEGCTPVEALGWAGQFTCWADADTRAVRVFVAATCRRMEAGVGVRGAAASNARFEALLGPSAAVA
ncbi:phosphotransferase [Streptomyces sp. NPDC051173]|uniref:phosphotransferase family protein n=1 Tax=Streptomyces sp. NPDC051173 TaxID=3155164 RepID=UPI00344DDEBF